MKKLPRISEILELTKPAFVKAKWTDGTTRTIDIIPVIEDALAHSDERFKPLLNWAIFNQVIVSDERTLAWPNLPQRIVLSEDVVVEGPLDLDPDVLYAESIPSGDEPVVMKIGKTIMIARMKNRISQAELGEMAGKDRHFISKVEAGAKDITATTLIKIFSALGSDLGALNPVMSKNKDYSSHSFDITDKPKKKERTDRTKRSATVKKVAGRDYHAKGTGDYNLPRRKEKK